MCVLLSCQSVQRVLITLCSVTCVLCSQTPICWHHTQCSTWLACSDCECVAVGTSMLEVHVLQVHPLPLLHACTDHHVYLVPLYRHPTNKQHSHNHILHTHYTGNWVRALSFLCAFPSNTLKTIAIKSRQHTHTHYCDVSCMPSISCGNALTTV